MKTKVPAVHIADFKSERGKLRKAYIKLSPTDKNLVGFFQTV